MRVTGSVWNGKEYELVTVELPEEEYKRLFGEHSFAFSLDPPKCKTFTDNYVALRAEVERSVEDG